MTEGVEAGRGREREQSQEFVKKPIPIKAIQYRDWMRKGDCLPEGVVILPWKHLGDVPCIHTLAGDMIVRDRDWVVTGVEGERYLIKDSIFRILVS